jgi:hypothetical protein
MKPILCNDLPPHLTRSLLGPNILLSALFSNTLIVKEHLLSPAVYTCTVLYSKIALTQYRDRVVLIPAPYS